MPLRPGAARGIDTDGLISRARHATRAPVEEKRALTSRMLTRWATAASDCAANSSGRRGYRHAQRLAL